MGVNSIDSSSNFPGKCDLDNGEIYNLKSGQTITDIRELSAIEVLKLLGGAEDYKE